MKINFKANGKKYSLDIAKFVSSVLFVIVVCFVAWAFISWVEIFYKNISSTTISEYNFYTVLIGWFA